MNPQRPNDDTRRAIMREIDRVLGSAAKPAPADFAGIGAKIQQGGREFEAIAVEPYTRRSDGAASVLVTWRGRCGTCEAEYQVKGSRTAKHLPVNCPAHRGRQPGRRPKAADAVRALRRLVRAAMSAMRQGKHQDAYGHLDAALLLTGRKAK